MKLVFQLSLGLADPSALMPPSFPHLRLGDDFQSPLGYPVTAKMAIYGSNCMLRYIFSYTVD
jgi:hypothetical protein